MIHPDRLIWITSPWTGRSIDVGAGKLLCYRTLAGWRAQSKFVPCDLTTRTTCSLRSTAQATQSLQRRFFAVKARLLG